MANLSLTTDLNFVDSYSIENRTGVFKVTSLGVSAFSNTQQAQSINLSLVGAQPPVYINIDDASKLTKIEG
jgi:hypothetical protein